MKKKFMALGCVLLAMAAAVPAGISTNIVHAEETVSDRAQVYEDIEKFPESYKDDLYELKKKHPDWIFEVYDTGLEWSSVMYNEMNPASRSLVPSYFSSDFVGGVYGDGWSYATEAAVEYYLDPRNWLTENYIFQFETLTYNAATQGIATVQKVLAGSFMTSYIEGYEEIGLTYAQAFHDIGAFYGVNPVHLASRVYQEQGTSGSSDLISGVYPGYEGYYNYYNIQASGSDHETIVKNGLEEAKSEGWNSRYAALKGGSKKLADRYILRGQDTLYLQKFDVDPKYDGRYWHQYMQNLCAPSNEGRRIKLAYEKAGMLDETFVFKIPVYKNMPEPYKAEHVLEEGEYVICMNGDGNLVFDVEWGSHDNGANVSLYTPGFNNNQKWYITPVEDGYYKIASVESGLMLDLAAGAKADGTNIDQWESNGGDNQKWAIVLEGDGTYSIISKATGRYVSVLSASPGSGANIGAAGKSDDYVQSFLFTRVHTTKDNADIEAGTYKIRISADNSFVVNIPADKSDNGVCLDVYGDNAGDNQKYNITRTSDGYYVFECAATGKVLTVEYVSTLSGARICQWEYNNGDNQKWLILKNDDGTYTIVSKSNGHAWDVNKGVIANNTEVITFRLHFGQNQRYVFEKLETVACSWDDDGRYLSEDGWHKVNGISYWYENGVRQGYSTNEDGSVNLAYRGKEIYDPSSNAWYWLDNVQLGAAAKSKDVYMESQADDAGTVGKWVRYDADGHMVKGWQTTDAGKYYFDNVYGTMAKGEVIIDGVSYYFDVDTGILQ